MSENTFNCNSVYNELRLNQELCDAVIRVDNAEFPVHKVILCSCTPYFRALFTRWSKPHRRVFDIPNVASDMMKLIIDFAYTNSVEVSQEKIPDLFIAADQFNVEGIMQTCSDVLESQLTPHNCIGTWWFADRYYNPALKHKSSMFILAHFEEIASSAEEFLQISAHELVEIIENDQLNVKKENTVFEAIIRWITFAPEERRKYISQLLSHVRLSLMSPQYILDVVRNNTFVKASEECRAILPKSLEAIVDLRTGTSSKPLARPRLPFAILFAVRGWTSDGPTSGIKAYDVRADCWVSITNDGDDPRACHGAAFLNGSLYCVGDYDGAEELSTMNRLDLITHTWQEVAPMHRRRCFVSITVLHGHLYAIGGLDGQEYLDTAERYEPSTNQWTSIAPMHDQRSNASCTTLHGKVYVCGGFNGTECLSSAECYNPETFYYKPSQGSIAEGSNVGGFDGTRVLRTAEAYNPQTNTWHAVPSMLNPRSNFGIELIDDQMFVVGGFNGLTHDCDVECFDFDTDEWSGACDMEINCSGLSCCVVYGLPNVAEYAAPRHSLQLSNEEYEAE